MAFGKNYGGHCFQNNAKIKHDKKKTQSQKV